ncbi:MAG: hypothetical protein U1D97_06220 [Desulfuromonadales bacterium]|nr:hypothetical protein [Desulfuromonadales bacterium]
MYWLYSIAPMMLGFFLLRFGMVSRGRKKEVIQFLGGIVCFSSVVLAWFLLGWKSWLGFIAIFFFVITPIEVATLSRTHKLRQYAQNGGVSNEFKVLVPIQTRRCQVSS